MGKVYTYVIISVALIIIIMYIGFMFYSNQYEISHSPYPNCTRMIKTDTTNIVIDGKMERKDIKSIVYSCKDGRIIQTNESIK